MCERKQALRLALASCLALSLVATIQAQDPPVSFIYSLSSGGKSLGIFMECSGLGSENQVVEHRSGSEPTVVRKSPGRLKYLDVSCRRGLTSDLSLWEWRRLVEQGNVRDARREVAVSLLDQTATEVARWELARSWPRKLVARPLSKAEDSDGPSIPLEEIVLVSEETIRVK